jgi:CheY-like chemotaxis protein
VSQKLASHLLTGMGHQVRVVGSGEEVLSEMDDGAFDLILMDLEMPRMDGLEATRRIRAAEGDDGGSIPIVALTAHTMRGDRDRCLEAGMNGHVAKPLREETLVGAIAAALGATR